MKDFVKNYRVELVCAGLLLNILMSIRCVYADVPYGCQSDKVSLSSELYVSQKYAGVISQVIDKYVVLCLNLERVVGKFELHTVRQLFFTHPCIIYCYRQMVTQKTVRPLAYLWQAYKDGTVTVDKQRFMYELCHLIALVFEQFLLQVAADLTGQSVQSLTQLLDKLEIDLPLDDLIDILEQCYQQLSSIADQLSQQQEQHAKTRKKYALVIMSVLVVVRYVYKYFKKPLGSSNALAQTTTKITVPV